MATTDACAKRITDELLMPGVGFWSISQFQGTTISGNIYYRGADYEHVSALAAQGDGLTFHAGISGRSLNRVLNDACDLMDEVAAEVAAYRASKPAEEPTDTAGGAA